MITEKRTIKFALNGRAVSADVPSHWNLVEMLQNIFGLTGARESCGQGLCDCDLYSKSSKTQPLQKVDATFPIQIFRNIWRTNLSCTKVYMKSSEKLQAVLNAHCQTNFKIQT